MGKEIYGFSEDTNESSTIKSDTISPNDGHVAGKELMENQYSEKQYQVKDHSQGSVQDNMLYGLNNGKKP